MATITTLPGFAAVTGAASGMGRATAKALVAAGVNGIALLDINEKGLEETRSLLSDIRTGVQPDVCIFICDMTLPESIEDAYNSIQSRFGRLDYSIHCAGTIVLGAMTATMSVAEFDIHHNVNYRGLWLCQRSALKIMLNQNLNCEAYPAAGIPLERAQRGAIVNISSNLAQTNIQGSSAYCASKAAVIALTRGDALDNAMNRVRINAVLPGLIDTPMTKPDLETRAYLEAGPLQRTPMKRFGQPEEVADVIVFLAGSGASFVTGSAWVVDGGFLTN